MVLKNVKEGWGHSSVAEALAGQAWGEEFGSPEPTYRHGTPPVLPGMLRACYPAELAISAGSSAFHCESLPQ